MFRISRMIQRVITIALTPAQVVKRTAMFNSRLWKEAFWEVWYPLPLDVKLAWIAFITQTIGILTLIEIVLFKK
jgi:hypothetical protein